MAPAAAPAPPARRSWLAYALTPDPSLNYGFLIIVYAVLSALTGMLAAVQYIYADAGIKGYWIITAPCVPGTLYLLYLRSQVGGTGWAEAEPGRKKRD